MRRSLASSLLALSVVTACTGEIGGTGGGDDDPTGPDAGMGAGADAAIQQTPRIDLTVDKPAVTTDLNVEQTVAVTVSAAMGFSGAVTLTASAVDAGSTAISGWSATLGAATVNVPANGTATATLALKLAPNTPALTGTVEITAASTAAPAEASVAVTGNPVAVVTITETAGKCAYPVFPVNNPLRLPANRALKIINGSTRQMIVHVDGGTGIVHQGSAMAPGANYTQTATVVGGQASFYCHQQPDGSTIDDVDAPSATQRPYLRVE